MALRPQPICSDYCTEVWGPDERSDFEGTIGLTNTTSVEDAVATSLPVSASTNLDWVKAMAFPQRSTRPVAT